MAIVTCSNGNKYGGTFANPAADKAVFCALTNEVSTQNLNFKTNNLTYIELRSVEQIDTNEFQNSLKLETLILPKAWNFAPWSFEKTIIKHLYLPEALNIAEYAFMTNDQFKTIKIPKVKVIGDSAFLNADCTELDLRNLEGIGKSAFASCKLTKLNIIKLNDFTGLDSSNPSFEYIINDPSTIVYIHPNVSAHNKDKLFGVGNWDKITFKNKVDSKPDQLTPILIDNKKVSTIMFNHKNVHTLLINKHTYTFLSALQIEQIKFDNAIKSLSSAVLNSLINSNTFSSAITKVEVKNLLDKALPANINHKLLTDSIINFTTNVTSLVVNINKVRGTGYSNTFTLNGFKEDLRISHRAFDKEVAAIQFNTLGSSNHNVFALGVLSSSITKAQIVSKLKPLIKVNNKYMTENIISLYPNKDKLRISISNLFGSGNSKTFNIGGFRIANSFEGSFTTPAKEAEFMAVTDTVTDSQFVNEKGLTSITMPNVTSIGNNAFSWAPLTHIEIPKCKLMDIGDSVFESVPNSHSTTFILIGPRAAWKLTQIYGMDKFYIDYRWL